MTDEPTRSPHGAGAEHFLIAKRNMLSKFRDAKAHAASRPVQTHHGDAAEGLVREWLAGFLPAKYGVCSGYIISQGLPQPDKLTHFDVIIFDRMEAPILWTDNVPGRADPERLVPAEHVYGVLEVKAKLTLKSAGDAMSKLQELEALLAGIDEGEPIPKYLPRNFTSGIIFFEVGTAEQRKLTIVEALMPEQSMRGYCGGIVLAAEGSQDPDRAGVFEVHYMPPFPLSVLGSGSGSMLTGVSASRLVSGEGPGRALMMFWGAIAFAKFAFDLLARMQGRYRADMLSSFHGIYIRPERTDAKGGGA